MAKTIKATRGTWTGMGRLPREGRGHQMLHIFTAKSEEGVEVRNTYWLPSNLQQYVNLLGWGACVEFTVQRHNTRSSYIADAIKTAAAEKAAVERETVPAKPVIKPVLQPKPTTSLARLLQYMSAVDSDGNHLNVMLVGPAGCGKSTIAKQAADELGLPFYSEAFTRDTPPWALTGKREPQAGGEWAYVTPAFVKAYENGGVILLDEMDAADGNALLALNMALANGYMAVPERIDNPVALRHKDVYVVAACNTYGSGSRVYVGRESLDEATLSRFVPLSVDYDIAYEAALLAKSTHGSDIAAFRDVIRKAINGKDGKGLRRVFSTRHLIQWIAMRDAGIPLDEITSEFFAAWSVADRQAAAAAGVPGAAAKAEAVTTGSPFKSY